MLSVFRLGASTKAPPAKAFALIDIFSEGSIGYAKVTPARTDPVSHYPFLTSQLEYLFDSSMKSVLESCFSNAAVCIPFLCP